MTGSLPLPHPAQVHPYCALLLAALCWGLASSSARACRVELAGEESTEWRRALARLSIPPDGCDSLRLEIDGDKARLLFSTRDGRQAVRRLGAPSELAPAIDALLVTSDAGGPAETASAPNMPPPATPASAVARRGAAPRAHELAPLVALLAGARAGRKVPMIGPLLNLEGHLRIDRWEVGLQLGWEVKYYDLMQGDAVDDIFGLVPALSFARRHPLSRATLLLGARAGMAATIPKHRLSPGPSRHDMDVAPVITTPRPTYQGWAGLLFGVVFPAHSPVRMRAELAADLSFATRYKDFTRYEPGWAVSLSIGAEYGES